MTQQLHKDTDIPDFGPEETTLERINRIPNRKLAEISAALGSESIIGQTMNVSVRLDGGDQLSLRGVSYVDNKLRDTLFTVNQFQDCETELGAVSRTGNTYFLNFLSNGEKVASIRCTQLTYVSAADLSRIPLPKPE